jgi:hypothetical protein
MDKPSKDKSSPSEDYNSPNSTPRSSEVPKPKKSKPFLKTRRSPKNSPKAHWEKLMLDKPEKKA